VVVSRTSKSRANVAPAVRDYVIAACRRGGNADPETYQLNRSTIRDRSRIIVLMNQLPLSKRVAVVSALVEGNSLRSTCRMTSVAMNTVLKLLGELGTACAAFHNATVRNIRAQRIQCDEIWQFIGAKQKNATPEKKAQGWGDTWTWTAIDADTKLMVSWFIGSRDATSAWWFMRDLTSRLITRVQLTSDGLPAYLSAVEEAFESEIDYAQLVKVYGAAREGAVRYSPAQFLTSRSEVIRGNPDPKHISTSYVERQNLTMRMSMRRFTRLTNGFSKKAENHAHAVALHYLHYNFARIHKTLRVTPAMEAGLANHVWSLEEIVGLLDRRSAVAA
jgi:IS1 family transposase